MVQNPYPSTRGRFSPCKGENICIATKKQFDYVVTHMLPCLEPNQNRQWILQCKIVIFPSSILMKSLVFINWKSINFFVGSLQWAVSLSFVTCQQQSWSCWNPEQDHNKSTWIKSGWLLGISQRWKLYHPFWIVISISFDFVSVCIRLSIFLNLYRNAWQKKVILMNFNIKWVGALPQYSTQNI